MRYLIMLTLVAVAVAFSQSPVPPAKTGYPEGSDMDLMLRFGGDGYGCACGADY